jgi:hypothetical protein
LLLCNLRFSTGYGPTALGALGVVIVSAIVSKLTLGLVEVLW